MNAEYNTKYYHIGSGYAEDYAVAGYNFNVLTDAITPNYVSFRGGETAATSYVQTQSFSNTAPFAWAAGDYLECYFVYESEA
jgi:hypothetical protein